MMMDKDFSITESLAKYSKALKIIPFYITTALHIYFLIHVFTNTRYPPLNTQNRPLSSGNEMSERSNHFTFREIFCCQAIPLKLKLPS